MHYLASINFQDPFHSELWNNYARTSKLVDDDDDDLEENQDDELLADSGSQGDSLDQMSCNQTTPELPSSPSSSDLSSSALFSDVIEKTKSIALHKLTNIEFWIHHLDSIFTEECIMRAAQDGWAGPDLSRSLIKEFLQIMNAHLLKTYPQNSTFPDFNKNFFPKLADILKQHIPILFGDNLNKEDIENFSQTEQPHQLPSSHSVQNGAKRNKIKKIDNDYGSDKEFIKQLLDQNHGKHRLQIIPSKKGKEHVLRCDGFYFKCKPNSRFENNYFKCTFRSCKAFIKIRNGIVVKYPSRASHLNHPAPKTLKLLKESGD